LAGFFGADLAACLAVEADTLGAFDAGFQIPSVGGVEAQSSAATMPSTAPANAATTSSRMLIAMMMVLTAMRVLLSAAPALKTASLGSRGKKKS
jgi:apolipoprotein N-acyltransferase